MKAVHLLTAASLIASMLASADDCVSLAGKWDFALGDSTNLLDSITLPSTTGIARKGDGRIGGKDVEKIDPERDDASVTSALIRHPTRRGGLGTGRPTIGRPAVASIQSLLRSRRRRENCRTD